MGANKIEFSNTEVRMIQSLWTSKPVTYIAMILDKPVSVVRDQISKMVKESPEPVRLWVRKTGNHHQPVSSQRRRNEKRWAAEYMKDEKQFKAPSMEGKTAVRLDHRTVVFVKPGTDIEALKAKYLKPKTY